jgi:hypothetical protein
MLFRRSFALGRPPERAVAKMSADSRYRMYVNGRSVAFGPCKGDDKAWFYDEADIAPMLRAGENVLAAVVLRYSLLRNGNHSVWRTRAPGLYFCCQAAGAGGDACEGGNAGAGGDAGRGRADAVGVAGAGADIGGVAGGNRADGASGGAFPLIADKTWRCRERAGLRIKPEHPLMQFLCVSEEAEGDARLAGWELPGYDDSDWAAASEYSIFEMHRAVSPGNLLPRPIPPLYERPARFAGVKAVRESSVSPGAWEGLAAGGSVELPANTSHSVEFDAGELTTGFLQLAVSLGAGSEIRLLASECYAYLPEPDAGNAGSSGNAVGDCSESGTSGADGTSGEAGADSAGNVDGESGTGGACGEAGADSALPAVLMPLKGDRADSENGTLFGFTDVYRPGGYGSAEAAPKERWRELMRQALDDGGLAQCSVAMAFYLFRAVEKAGLYGETKRLWQPWRDMVAKNLTTCEENGLDARSDCHAWGSLALYELPAVVLGVRPTKPGFREFEVRPNPGWLDWARGSVITPLGPVRVEWERAGAGLDVRVQAPDGVEPCGGGERRYRKK